MTSTTTGVTRWIAPRSWLTEQGTPHSDYTSTIVLTWSMVALPMFLSAAQIKMFFSGWQEAQSVSTFVSSMIDVPWNALCTNYGGYGNMFRSFDASFFFYTFTPIPTDDGETPVVLGIFEFVMCDLCLFLGSWPLGVPSFGSNPGWGPN